MSCGDIFLGLIAILFPPIAVWIKCGFCSADSLINILLLVLGYLPGLLHAWYIIAKHPEYDYEQVPDAESGAHGRVTYYYISHESAPTRGGNGQRTYGTNNGARPARAPPVPANRPQPSRSSVDGPPGPSRGAGSDLPGAPPSYADAVKGDNKIQSPN